MATENEKEGGGWKVDRHVPIALIGSIGLFMLAQTAAGSWWASGMSSRVEQLEKDRAASAPQAERLIKVETKVESIDEKLKDISTFLRDKWERMQQPSRSP